METSSAFEMGIPQVTKNGRGCAWTCLEAAAKERRGEARLVDGSVLPHFSAETNQSKLGVHHAIKIPFHPQHFRRHRDVVCTRCHARRKQVQQGVARLCAPTTKVTFSEESIKAGDQPYDLRDKLQFLTGFVASSGDFQVRD